MAKIKSISEKKSTKANGGLSVLKNITENVATGTKISAHNALICGIYAMCMVIAAFVCVYLSCAISAVCVGYMGVMMLASVADLIAFFAIIITVCGFILFFGFKIENALIHAMRKRMWRRGEDKEIIKGDFARKIVVDTSDMPKAVKVK